MKDKVVEFQKLDKDSLGPTKAAGLLPDHSRPVITSAGAPFLLLMTSSSAGSPLQQGVSQEADGQQDASHHL